MLFVCHNSSIFDKSAGYFLVNFATLIRSQIAIYFSIAINHIIFFINTTIKTTLPNLMKVVATNIYKCTKQFQVHFSVFTKVVQIEYFFLVWFAICYSTRNRKMNQEMCVLFQLEEILNHIGLIYAHFKKKVYNLFISVK